MRRRLGVWIGGIALMLISLYLYLINPLEVKCNLTLVILIWAIIILIVDYLFRKNETYGKMKAIIKFIVCIAIYLMFAICEYILLGW